MPASAFAATLSVSPSSGSYQTGNIITAQIMLTTQGAPIEGVDIRYLNYDPALLEVQDENTSIAGVQIAPGTLMPNTVANSVNTALGRIEFSQVISGNATFNGSGVLATTRFRVLAPGSASSTFNFTSGNTADTNVASGGIDVLTSVTNATYTLTTPPVQQGSPIVYFSPSSTAKVTGTSFPLDIILDTRGRAIDGADIVVSYNRAMVSIIDVDGNKTGVQIAPGTLMPTTTINDVAESRGQITFSQTTAANGTFSGSGILGTITVRALAPGAASVAFTFTKGRTNDTNVSFGGVDLLDAVTNTTIQITENNAAPMVMGFEPSGVIALPRSVALKVSTNEWATCKYATASGTQYLNMTRNFSSSDGAMHSATMSSGFQAGQNDLYVRCKDKAGNVMNTDAVISFFIAIDTSAPFVSQMTPSGTFFLPKNIHISVVPQDQSGVASCKFSMTPYTDYNAMPRSLSLRGDVFSALVSGNDLRIGQNNFYVRCKDKVGNVNTSDAVISFTLFSPPTFMVGMEGREDVRSYTFVISLFTPGSATELVKISARPNTTGAIVLSIDNNAKNISIGPGNYDVRISADNYLGKKFMNMGVWAGSVISVPQLLAGDLNKDGVINSLDWSMMNTEWSKTSSLADINKDGRVNSLDWGYIRKNWLQTAN